MKRSRLRQRSAKRAEETEQRRDAMLQVHARDGHNCAAEQLVPEVTCGGCLDGHEPRRRSQGGDPLDPDQIIQVCRRHHDWVGNNPAAARERGLTR